MTSTEIKQGLTGVTRPSSRVLKPPGGGHTNIFGEADAVPNNPRPKYNQQNSSNLNGVMNTVDPNISLEKPKENVEQTKVVEASEKARASAEAAQQANGQKASSPIENQSGSRSRVPPGGFSSGGFW